jgi:hypothetical protein
MVIPTPRLIHVRYLVLYLRCTARLADWLIADLAGHMFVWLASPEADFLKGKFVWSNWDAEELVARKEEILADKFLLTWMVNGVPA